jgi:hypothetical protein
MSRKYVAFMPVDPNALPERERIDAAVASLIEAGAVQGDRRDPASLANGPGTASLFTDPDPRKREDGLGIDPGRMSFRIHAGDIAGFSGDNLEPVACVHCNSELPYNCAQDAFWALRDGKPIDDPMMSMECYHCGKSNSALEADWGRSGGFARLAFIFEGDTSNRVEPNPEGLRMLAEKLGTPVRFIQVHSW